MNEEKDNITKENEDRLASIGYTGGFPITCRLASEWLEAKFPGSTLRPTYKLWREDLLKAAFEKYPEMEINYYHRRNYIIELAIDEITAMTKVEQSNNDNVADFFRPKTMAELLEALKKGIKCEVANGGVEIVNIKLDGWLNFAGKYKTLYSPNKGYVIYEAV